MPFSKFGPRMSEIEIKLIELIEDAHGPLEFIGIENSVAEATEEQINYAKFMIKMIEEFEYGREARILLEAIKILNPRMAKNFYKRILWEFRKRHMCLGPYPKRPRSD